MADRICTDSERLHELAVMMRKLASELNAASSRTRGVPIDRESGANVEINASTGMLECIDRRSATGSVRSCLRSVASCLQDMEQYATQMSRRINLVADEVEYTEKSLVNLYEGETAGNALFESASQAIAVGALPSHIRKMFDPSFWNDAQIVMDGDLIGVMKPGASYIFDQHGLIGAFERKTGLSGVKETARIYTGSGQRLKAEFEAGFSAMGAKYENDLLEQSKLYEDFTAIDAATGEEVKDYKKRKGDPLQLLTVGTGMSASVSALGDEFNFDDGKQQAHLSAGLLNAEAHLQGNAGFGVYIPDENGNMELYLGAGGEVGMSVSAAQAEASYEYELCDWVDVGVKADTKVLSASAKAGGGIGIVGDEVVAYVEASAEANLIEASVEGSLNVGGIEGTVGGSVVVGAGAHAKFGYDDGTIVMDVGLALGVGVSFNVELDVSEAVDNLADKAKDVGEAVTSFVDGIGSFCGWW